eukprot:TRINITY_DN22517_c0_g1_i2.p2 TRINITY_DN22517_c0_g1~~TRINITY_DN22517_c0_g1_i2.p2  ORF type:complete len:129 (+),score=16.39 TRINITY_DN22517_c0_g1_i2:251-637(+)
MEAEKEKALLENQLQRVNFKIKNLKGQLLPIDRKQIPQSVIRHKLMSPVEQLTQKRLNNRGVSVQRVNYDTIKDYELLKEQLKLDRQQQILERLRDKKLLKEKQKEKKQQSQQFVKKLYKHPYYKLMD